MTKTSRLTLQVVAVTSVAWLGVACGPQEEAEPEATATVAAEPDLGPDDKPTWKDCMANPNCIAGARVQVQEQGEDPDRACTVLLRPWFATDAEPEPHVIDVDAKGRVFFLVQWQEACKGQDVYLTHPPGDHPWDNDCHERAWTRNGQKSFKSVRCEIVDIEDDKDYRFCLETDPAQECTSDRTGGTVRVRGSGPKDKALSAS